MMKLMKQAKNLKNIQKEIAKTTVEDEINGARLTITGDGSVKSFEISEELYQGGREKINSATAAVINSCFKKQMNLFKEKAKNAMGGLDLSGLMG
ncbi:MAG: YbaB/EbfC family nucleoid-associated protein [Elusimicrobiota bacterium]